MVIMRKYLLKYRITEAQGQMLVRLLGIKPLDDILRKDARGVLSSYFEGYIFDREGGSYHIKIKRFWKGRRNRVYFIVDHYDSPGSHNSIPSLPILSKGDEQELNKIRDAISAVRDKKSDIYGRQILRP